eukprot:239752-Chlamydomonas_euryale.AAC.14
MFASRLYEGSATCARLDGRIARTIDPAADLYVYDWGLKQRRPDCRGLVAERVRGSPSAWPYTLYPTAASLGRWVMVMRTVDNNHNSSQINSNNSQQQQKQQLTAATTHSSNNNSQQQQKQQLTAATKATTSALAAPPPSRPTPARSHFSRCASSRESIAARGRSWRRCAPRPARPAARKSAKCRKCGTRPAPRAGGPRPRRRA